jgi:hypothetical protein
VDAVLSSGGAVQKEKDPAGAQSSGPLRRSLSAKLGGSLERSVAQYLATTGALPLPLPNPPNRQFTPTTTLSTSCLTLEKQQPTNVSS